MEEELKLYKIEYFVENIVSKVRRTRLGLAKFMGTNGSRLESTLVPGKDEKDAKDKYNSDIRLKLEEKAGNNYKISQAVSVEKVRIRGYDITIKLSSKK